MLATLYSFSRPRNNKLGIDASAVFYCYNHCNADVTSVRKSMHVSVTSRGLVQNTEARTLTKAFRKASAAGRRLERLRVHPNWNLRPQSGEQLLAYTTIEMGPGEVGYLAVSVQFSHNVHSL